MLSLLGFVNIFIDVSTKVIRSCSATERNNHDIGNVLLAQATQAVSFPGGARASNSSVTIGKRKLQFNAMQASMG